MFKKNRLKMLLKKSVISGNTGVNLFFTLLKTAGVLFLVAIVLYLIYRVARSGVQGDVTIHNIVSNPKELLEIIFSIITIAASSYACVQIYLMKDINRTEMCHEIYKADQEYRMQAERARIELALLVKTVNEKQITLETEEKLHNEGKESELQALLLRQDFKNLRAFVYHYEYIGYLTLRDKLNFSVAFDTITFPNWLMISDDAKFIIALGRVDMPDFWNGSEYLYCSYEVRRKYNAYKKNTEDKSLKKKYITACKIWEEKYSSLI